MPFLLKDTIHNTLVDVIYNEILTRRSNYYYYIGKILTWPDPNNPDTPEKTRSYEDEIRNRIISIKRINISDVSYVIPRIDWVLNTVYDMFDENYSPESPAYSGATSLKEAQFYVLTSNFGVYKCLFNNNNSPSTIEPFGLSPLPITLSDGYVWKYMYSIPLSSRSKFLNSVYMPVQRAITNAYYSNGEIDRVTINNKGSGYIGNSEVTLTVQGEFAGAEGNSIANLVPVITAGGSIEKVIIKDPGNNYVTANILINDLPATGISYYYGLSNVSIYDQGSGYDTNVIANTTATIATTGLQPGSNANITLVFTDEKLIDFVIENNGSGYTPDIAANTTLTITTTGDLQPTSNATANLYFASTAILRPILLDGKIDRVVIEDPGSNYSSNIQTTIVVVGDGSNASLLPYVNENGEIGDVIILNRGQGYSYVNLTVIGDGTGADLSVDLTTGDLDTLQSSVELSAIPGALYAFRVHDAGVNYTEATITVDGDGTGFVGNVVLSNTNTISRIEVVTPGANYTFANVIISGNGSNANVSAILSPYEGHGKRPINEFFADTLMLYSTISVEKIHDVDVNNDYRQYGILKDPKNYAGTLNWANAIGTPCILVTLNTLNNAIGGTLQDDTVLELASDRTRKFEVVETVTANTNALLTTLNNYELQVNDILNDPLTDSNYQVAAIVKTPTINKFSGEMLYVDNRTRISYSDEQLVTLRTILRL